MFVLRNVGKLIFGGGTQESLIELPQGQLLLVRPLSPKGYLELIFRDSAVRICRTTQDFNYQLVVQRVFDEGEAELLAEEGGEETGLDDVASERDEKTFLLDEQLRFHVVERDDGGVSLAWRDLHGDDGDFYQFDCDSSVTDAQIRQFAKIARECQYERKYRKPNTTASDEDIEQFHFAAESSFPQTNEQIEQAQPDEPVEMPPVANSPVRRKRESGGRPSLPEGLALGEEYVKSPAELRVYNPEAAHFVTEVDNVVAAVYRDQDKKSWKYWLVIKEAGDATAQPLVVAPCVPEMSPVVDPNLIVFVFNHVDFNGVPRSRLLRFETQDILYKFHEGIMTALWESKEQTKWTAHKEEKDKEYVLDSFGDLNMEDADAPEEEEEEEEEEEIEDEESEVYDSEEEEGDEPSGDINSQLAVGYKHDRSFVVRGNKIGVFTHTPNNNLKFSTNISKVINKKGKALNPKKVMLHGEDRDLIMQDENDPHKLYRMDLEYGKVVDEYGVDDENPLVTFAPKSKFSQMTGEKTFFGASADNYFMIDPRLSGGTVVDETTKSKYKGGKASNQFSSLATTEKGYIAVASAKGEIRLFDRPGIRAKTQLPSLGDPVYGIDVSADGKWLLGTTKNYILLIDVQQKSGDHEGKLGFERAFAKDQKPRPLRLNLTPEHVAQYFHETGKAVSFTQAKFNTGQNAEETSIITATGPYIVEWNLNKVLRGAKNPYRIKRYEEEVKADDFKFGSDKNVIVALPNQVNMVAKGSLKRPTPESIAEVAGGKRTSGGGRRSSGRIGTRESGRYKLGRDDIVNSPY